MERIAWEELPHDLRQAIALRTGPILAASTATAGENSPVAATITTAGGKTFVKGLPSSHRRVATQEREVAVAPLVKGISPALLWHFDGADVGWNVLGYEHIDGRHADFTPGSTDLDELPSLISAVNDIRMAEAGVFKRAEDRWKNYVREPGDALVFSGDALTHTDLAPHNVLAAADRLWLIDWAWPTLGAAWTDPAHWIIRLIAAGHTPRSAEKLAARLPAFADADPRHVDLFAQANARLWDEITHADASSRSWTAVMADAARRWVAHREGH